MAFELQGDWPAVVEFVIIVLLPKPDGGRRPIGLFPAIIRVWARARHYLAAVQASSHPRAAVYSHPWPQPNAASAAIKTRVPLKGMIAAASTAAISEYWQP